MQERLGVSQSPSGWAGPNELLLASGTRQKNSLQRRGAENSEQEEEEK